jgi:hypothetical protein
MSERRERQDEVRRLLWNESAPDARYTDVAAARADVVEQYKLYVEMADAISQRRGLTNTFFLTINTAIFTAIGVVWNAGSGEASVWLVVPLIAVLGQCGAWFYLLRSYRLLNTAKFDVIGLLEERLPVAPYAAEWKALGEGKDRRLYWPLSHVEKWVPVLFMAAYVSGYLALVTS